MTDHAAVNVIACHHSFNGFDFGCPQAHLERALGPPDHVRQNTAGELELHYATTIYRFLFDRLIECTFADRGRTRIDGIEILSPYEWLAGRPDVVDRARFRISLNHGIAYDARDPDFGSITVFERGRWDALVNGG